MNPPNPKVDSFFARAKAWQAELELLRDILLGCELAEELKWGKPTYASEGSNIVLLMPLKESCALLFLKGALLEDPRACWSRLERIRSRPARCGSLRRPRSRS